MKLLLTLLLVGCGTLPDGIVQNGIDNARDATGAGLMIDPLLIPDYNLFIERCARSKHAAICDKNAQKLRSIKVVDLINSPTPTVGVCYVGKFGRKIEVTREKALEGGIALKSLLYHELTHCLMGLGHNDNGVHIMNSYDFPVREGEWESLVDDLFE